MKMRRTGRVARTALTIALAAPLAFGNGCTVIGWSIGKSLESSPLPSSALAGSAVGATVTVRQFDGTRVEGTLVGTSTDPTYRQRYAAFRASLSPSSPPPALDETVVVAMKNGRVSEAVFRGFDRVIGRAAPGYARDGRVLRLDLPGNPEPIRVHPNLVQSVRLAGGRSISAPDLQRIASDPSLPDPTLLLVRTSHGTVAVPLERVERMEIRDHPHAKTALMVIGGVLDLAYIAGAIAVAVALSDGMDLGPY